MWAAKRIVLRRDLPRLANVVSENADASELELGLFRRAEPTRLSTVATSDAVTRLRPTLISGSPPYSLGSSGRTTAAERAVAATLQANCQSPVASFATITGDVLTLEALVALPDGSKVLREKLFGNAADAALLGNQIAARLLERGASAMLEEIGE